MNKLTTAIAFALLLFAGCSAGKTSLRTDAEAGPEQPKAGGQAFLGVSMTAAPDIKPVKGTGAKHGVHVHFVLPDSPADKAGMKADDIIIAVGPGDLDAPADAVLQQFRDRLAAFSPGETAKIKVVREETLFDIREGGSKVKSPEKILADLQKHMREKDPGAKLSLKARNVRRMLTFDVTLCERPAPGGGKYTCPEDGEIHPELSGFKPPTEQLAETLVEHYKVTENYSDLRERLGRLEETHEGFRLPEVAYLHRNPFHMEKVADGIFDALERNSADIAAAGQGQLFEAMRLLGEKVKTSEREALHIGISLQEHLLQIEQVLKTAGEQRKKAFAALTEEDLQFIRDNIGSLAEVFEKAKYIHTNEDREAFRKHVRLIELARKVKYAYLYYAAMDLQQLLSPHYLEGLRKDIETAGLDTGKEVIAEKDTPWGKIIVGGTGNNWYKDEDAAVIIDLGGDDFYTNNAGASTKEIGCALVIDLGGDDAYESTHGFAQGAGFLGAGILADFWGDDSYVGLRWCQGACAYGIGILLDSAGDDTYRAHAYAQGAALWGAAICADIEGCDSYQSHQFAQGLGACGGVGILADTSGDDSYYAKGTYPTSYGTPGVYEGWSQGCGVGFRQYGSGGIGILLDMQGADRYEAGNFSQGGGYYYGWGLLGDRGGEADTYIGSRYAQGFCAHQALGTFIEEGGNDTYASRNSVHAGLAWDECVTLFLDCGGDDNYSCPRGFSQGASAHNAICIFTDASGKDIYATKGGPGRAGGNDYHGGTSLSLFMDLGGQEDSYVKRGENNSVSYRPEDSLVLDLPSSGLENLEEIMKLCKPYEPPKKPKEEKQEEKKK